MTTSDEAYAEMNAAHRRARARVRYRQSLVVLVIAAVVAGLLLWRDLRDDRPHAKAGLVSQATQDLPVQWRRTVLVPGVRYDVTAAVREDVTDEPAVATMQAPDDGTFVGLGIDESDDRGPDIADNDGRGPQVEPTQVTLIADGHRYPLSTDRTADSPYERKLPTRLPLHGWLAVDGDADRLVLEVVWQRRTQRVDLRTGDRTVGDFGPLYAQRSLGNTAATTASCGAATWTPGWRVGPGVPVACSYRADLLAWSGQKGWAKAGRRWLAITVTMASPTNVIRRVGSRDVDYYASGYAARSASARTPAESPDRLDGARPVALTYVRGDYTVDETAVLVFDVARTAGAHTAVLTQLVDVDERAPVTPPAREYEDGVRQTWTVRIPA